MTFEFVIACRMTPGADIKQVLTGPLVSALEDTQNDFGEGMVADMLQVRSERIGSEALADDEGTGNFVLIGFAVELPDETVSMGTVIDTFVESLPTTTPIFHAVKFEDPLLREELAHRAAEIFELEMKLRRVLTIIYLYSYQEGDPFELLRDESEQPTARNLAGKPFVRFRATRERRISVLYGIVLDGIRQEGRYTIEIRRSKIGDLESIGFPARLLGINRRQSKCERPARINFSI